MARLTALVLMVLLVPAVTPAQEVAEEVDVTRIVSELRRGDSSSLGNVTAMPVAEADKALREMLYEFRHEEPSVRAVISGRIGTLPGVEKIYRARWESLPPLVENTSARYRFLELVSQIHTRWALNILGEALMDARPLVSKLQREEFDAYRAQFGEGAHTDLIAAAAMAGMNLRSAPDLGKPMEFRREHQVKKLQQWWLANKDKPDEFFFGQG
jgi:hypothetical protein